MWEHLTGGNLIVPDSRSGVKRPGARRDRTSRCRARGRGGRPHARLPEIGRSYRLWRAVRGAPGRRGAGSRVARCEGAPGG